MPIDQNDPYRGNLLMLLPLIYILPTYVMYVIVVYVMVFSKASTKFKTNSFYQLFIMQSVTNVVFSMTQYFKFRASNAAFFLPLFDLIPERTIFLTLRECISYEAFVGQALLDTFISVNRMTAFFLREKYKRFWKRAIWVAGAIVLFVPVLTWWQYTITDVNIKLYNESNHAQGYWIGEASKDRVPWQKTNRNLAIFFPILAFISLFMNIYVAWNLRIRIKATKVETEDQKQDLKLFFFTVFLFFSQICSAFIQAGFFFWPSDTNLINFISRAQSFVTDVNCLGPLWMILLLNKYLKAEVLSLLHLKFKKTEGTTVVVSMSSLNKRMPTMTAT